MDEDADWKAVLSYWFRPDANKSLWFVPRDDQKKLVEVDKDISKKFSPILQAAEKGDLDEAWGCHGSKEVNIKPLLALVVVLDQFSRHVYRSQPDKQDLVSKNTVRAAEHSRWAVENQLAFVLDGDEFSFLLMPFRHLRENVVQNLRYVVQCVEEYESRTKQARAVLEKFKAATASRLEQAVATSRSSGYTDEDILDPQCVEEDSNVELIQASPLYGAILDFLVDSLPDIKDLRREPRPCEKSYTVFVSLSGGVDSMAVCRILVEIAQKNLLLLDTRANRQGLNSKLTKKRKLKPLYKSKPADVRSHRQSQEQDKARNQFEKNQREKYSPCKIELCVVAIHIDYGNRPESGAEADFVEQWCKRHNVVFRKRRIDEFRRGVTPRAEYEERTREIRFETYRNVLNEFNGDDSSKAIIYGHHRGDVQENVISNAMRGSGILELSGMTKISTKLGVVVWRPLLDFPKSDIYDFAHSVGVPYFKDTTPLWSTRGKLRNRLIPTIAETYGKGFLGNLACLAKDSDELNILLNEVLFQPFWDKVEYGKLATMIRVDGYEDKPVFFWKHALKKVCHRIRVSAIHERPMMFFLERVRGISSQEGHNFIWIELKRDNRTCLWRQGEKLWLLLFNPAFLWNLRNRTSSRASARETAKLPVRPILNESMESPFKIESFPCSFVINNHWKITISLRDEDGNAPSSHTNIANSEEFFKSGCIAYKASGPASDAEFVLSPEQGDSVPAFGKLPMKIRNFIPIVVPTKSEPCLEYFFKLEFRE